MKKLYKLLALVAVTGMLSGCAMTPVKIGQTQRLPPGAAVTFVAPASSSAAALQIELDIDLDAIRDALPLGAVQAQNWTGTGWLVVGAEPSAIKYAPAE